MRRAENILTFLKRSVEYLKDLHPSGQTYEGWLCKDKNGDVTCHFRNTIFAFSALEGLDLCGEEAVEVSNRFQEKILWFDKIISSVRNVKPACPKIRVSQH